MRKCHAMLLSAACAVVVSGSSAMAAVYTWKDTANSGNWDNSSSWTAGSGYPNSPDDEAAFVTGGSNHEVYVGANITVGRIRFNTSPNWNSNYVGGTWGSTAYTITLQGAGGAPAEIYTDGPMGAIGTTAMFGQRYNGGATGLTNAPIALASDLLIDKNTAGSFNVSFGWPVSGKQAPMSCVGGVQHDIRIVGSGGTGQSVTAVFQSDLSTNVSNYHVDATNGSAMLAYCGDSSLGNAANKTYLVSGAVVRATLIQSSDNNTGPTSGTVITDRSMFGSGVLQARANPGITNGDAKYNVTVDLNFGGRLSPGNGLADGTVGALALDATSVTLAGINAIDIDLAGHNSYDTITTNCPVTLGGSLNLTILTGYAPDGADSWTILHTSQGTITGTFASITPGYQYSIENGGTDVVISRVPEPAALSLAGLAALGLLRRRVR